jgi:hypothetical protein
MPYKDKQKQKEYQKAWDARRYSENKDTMLEYGKKWKRDNREHCKEYNRQWQLNNRDKANVSGSIRRARQSKGIPDFLRNCRIERDRLSFIYLLREWLTKSTGIVHHVDHMWPLSDGGPHWSGNLQVITERDNLKKGSTVCPSIKQNVQEALTQERKRYECMRRD